MSSFEAPIYLLQKQRGDELPFSLHGTQRHLGRRLLAQVVQVDIFCVKNIFYVENIFSYKGTAEKCKFVGETVRHFNAGKPATFELFAPGAKKGDVDVNIISKSPRVCCQSVLVLCSRVLSVCSMNVNIMSKSPLS